MSRWILERTAKTMDDVYPILWGALNRAECSRCRRTGLLSGYFVPLELKVGKMLNVLDLDPKIRILPLVNLQVAMVPAGVIHAIFLPKYGTYIVMR